MTHTPSNDCLWHTMGSIYHQQKKRITIFKTNKFHGIISPSRSVSTPESLHFYFETIIPLCQTLARFIFLFHCSRLRCLQCVPRLFPLNTTTELCYQSYIQKHYFSLKLNENLFSPFILSTFSSPLG